jgi:DNA-binding response OmpR family regulator
LNMKGARILLIISNWWTLKLLSDMLTAAGARVFGTSSGEQGLHQHHLFHPDLVIVDLELAGLDGRQNGTRLSFPPNMAVILLTTLGEEYLKSRGLDFEGAECFVKPFSVDALLNRIQQILLQEPLTHGPEPSPRSMGKGLTKATRAPTLHYSLTATSSAVVTRRKRSLWNGIKRNEDRAQGGDRPWLWSKPMTYFGQAQAHLSNEKENSQWH